MRIPVSLLIAFLLPVVAQAQAPAAAAPPAGGPLFQQNCSGCHGNNGEGGVGPSFVGNNDIADASAMLQTVLFGKGAMPAWGPQLTDDEIAAITTFERTSWGNTFGAITAAQVTQARSAGEAQQAPAAAAPAAASAVAPGAADAVTIDVADGTALGVHLVTGDGLPLYRFLNDAPAGTSTCYSPCDHRWTALLATGTPTAGTNVEASLLGTVARTDGTSQVTYNGWPLYTNVDDKPVTAGSAPAEPQAAGVGISDLWQLVSPGVAAVGRTMQ